MLTFIYMCCFLLKMRKGREGESGKEREKRDFLKKKQSTNDLSLKPFLFNISHIHYFTHTNVS